MIDSEYVNDLDGLTNYVPSPGDLIRYMVRDVDNADVVKTFGLDEGFTNNYVGQIKVWAGMNNVGDDVMLREWRSHWSIPSPTQLYNILHKLRHNDKYGGAAVVEGWVKEALIQQDILPFWIDKLMDISYLAINKTDATTAFQQGWIDEKALRNYLYQEGYSDGDTDTLVKLASAAFAHRTLGSDYGKLYISGDIDADQARSIMDRLGVDKGRQVEIFDILDEFRALAVQREQLDSLDRHYKACLISAEQYREDGIARGIPGDVLTQRLKMLKGASNCGFKRERITAVTSAYVQGLITRSDAIDRIDELGYDQFSRNLYIQMADEKISNAEKKARAKAEAAEKRAEEAKAKAALRAEKAAASASKANAANAARLERARQSRNGILMRAADYANKYNSLGKPESSEWVSSTFRMLQSEMGLSQNEAARAIQLATMQVKGGTEQDLTDEAILIAQAALSDPWSLYATPPSDEGGM